MTPGKRTYSSRPFHRTKRSQNHLHRTCRLCHSLLNVTAEFRGRSEAGSGSDRAGMTALTDGGIIRA